MKNPKKVLVWAIPAAAVVLGAVVVLAVCLANRPIKAETPSGKYSWEDYLNMSLEEQDAFRQQFPSMEDFDAWAEQVNPQEDLSEIGIWDKFGKTPDKYSWSEYQALSREDQEAFYQWFDSEADFEAWMNSVKPDDNSSAVERWNKPGKLPDEYTWEEYGALTAEEQEAFFLWFDSEAAFEAWMNAALPKENDANDWKQPGKSPDQYTWEEYQALTDEEQEAFFLWFNSEADFEAWMERVKPAEDVPVIDDWNKPGKLPDAYTWEEYLALTDQEQESFYQWFGSLTAFEAWMNSVKPAEENPVIESWNKPGKLPNEYTWAEYQALTPEEQEAFYQWFDSTAEFEAWMEEAEAE